MVRPKPNTDDTSSGHGCGDAPSTTGYPAHPHSVPQHHAAAYGKPQPAPYPPTAYGEPQPAPYPPMSNVNVPGEAQPMPYPPQPMPYPPVPGEAQPKPYPPQPMPYPPQPLPTTPTNPVPFPPTRPPPTPPVAPANSNANGAYGYGMNVGEQWSTELFDFDMSQDYAIATAICPCVTFGQIAEIIDEGQTSCLLAGMLYMVMIPALFTCSALSSNYRRKLREKYNLVEAPSDDCTVHLINPCCALCQEYRELQKRGFDPSVGWEANIAQQHQDAAIAPPQNQFMST